MYAAELLRATTSTPTRLSRCHIPQRAGQRDILDCFQRLQHVTWKGPAVFVPDAERAFAEYAADSGQPSQLARRWLCNYADEILGVIAEKQGRVAKRWEWSDNQRADSIGAYPVHACRDL